jgi:predicted CoA-binding protein
VPSEKEAFFSLSSFAVVGNSDLKAFPKLTYGNLRQLGKTVYPVELGPAASVDGDQAYASLTELPGPVEGVIIELPAEHVMPVVEQCSAAGIGDVWLHMGTDTPAVLDYCQEQGMRVRRGTCAVMYTQQGLSFHSIHKGIMKLLGRY